MEAAFWHQKWSSNDIAFHGKEAHPLLVQYFQTLGLSRGARVFLPLCGKTLDIPWMLSRGFRAAGAELSRLAVEQLFDELRLKPEVTSHGSMDQYSASGIDIFAGDIFHLSGRMLGHVDAVYDRAALVALPEEMRSMYARHLTEITHAAPQLLICYEYDQSLVKGPPFSIGSGEVHRLYENEYLPKLLAGEDISGGLKGMPAMESVWLLQPAAGPAQAA